jgi:hypothetical protein
MDTNDTGASLLITVVVYGVPESKDEEDAGKPTEKPRGFSESFL